MSNFKEQSYTYKRVKVNKFDSQYIIDEKEIKDCFLTGRIKIESYQNFSKATNLDYYFRLRGLTSWKGGESVTGLFKTINPNIYFGDRKKDQVGNIKRTIIFQFLDNGDRLKITLYPKGFPVSANLLNAIVRSL